MRQEQLRFDEVKARYGFSDGVLDLDARVDFEEEEFAKLRVDEELESPERKVVDLSKSASWPYQSRTSHLLGNGNCSFNNSTHQASIRNRAGRDLDHLLIPPLDAAFSLPHVTHAPFSISNDLHFDVAESINSSLFGKHLPRRTLFNRTSGCARQLLDTPDETDASSSTSIDSFDHDWKPDSCRKRFDVVDAIGWLLQGRTDRHSTYTCQTYGCQ